MNSKPVASRLCVRPQNGFVLAVTLWILAGIAIAVGLMTVWSLDQVAQARIGHERLQDEIALSGSRDTLLYIAATRELTLAGLPVRPLDDDQVALRRLDEFGALIRDPIGTEMRLDDTPYAGMPGALFAIQDEAGLYPLSPWMTGRGLDRFLVHQGVEEAAVPRLRDALLDYMDSDDLTRLNGAESREYERAGRPPPANRRLLTPGELGNVLGWDALGPDVLDAIVARVTPYYAGAINPNTMPADMLPIWVSGCPEACDRIVAARRSQPFRSALDMQMRLGVLLPGGDAGDYRFLADQTLRMTLWGRSGAAWRMHVRLTPLADKQGPWSIMAAYPIVRPSIHDPAEDTGSEFFADPTALRE
ncbi:general secretion pathway protein GspK [Luteimonas terrae]|nr:type II secretion system protein GspK [Luteimonas terrae]